MSSDGNNNNGALGTGPPPGHRRSSITQAALSNLFQRPPPTSANAFVYPVNDAQRRRLSVIKIGLSGTSPTNPTPFGIRRGSRGSHSTSPDSVDESAVEEEELPPGSIKTSPTMPFVHRMSFGSPAMRSYRPGGSPGNDQHVFNWSEHLRCRAESSVSGARPYASSPPRGAAHHDRTKSVSDMPQPPAQASAVKPKPESRKPDAFQERILKGDFYMD